MVCIVHKTEVLFLLWFPVIRSLLRSLEETSYILIFFMYVRKMRNLGWVSQSQSPTLSTTGCFRWHIRFFEHRKWHLVPMDPKQGTAGTLFSPALRAVPPPSSPQAANRRPCTSLLLLQVMELCVILQSCNGKHRQQFIYAPVVSRYLRLDSFWCSLTCLPSIFFF